MLTDDLADALVEHPGLTADQLAGLVAGAPGAPSEAHGAGAVRLALSGEPGRFCCDRSDPPRWWLAAAGVSAERNRPSPLTPVVPLERAAPAQLRSAVGVLTPVDPLREAACGRPASRAQRRASALLLEPSPLAVLAARPDRAPAPAPAPARAPAPAAARLYAWQTDALEAWARRGHRGVVEAVTGTGKTVLGLVAVAEELRRGGQALVLVPTVELMHQWRREIHRFLGPQVRVGCLGGNESASLVVHDVVVAVVNSARVSSLRPIRRDGLLVADECHRYASTANRLALGESFARRLGLSATYARDDGAHLEWLEPYFGGTCFEMGYRRAAADGVTARFSLALVGIELPPEEQERYEELSEEITRRLARLIQRHGVVPEPFVELLKALHLLASGRFPSEAQAEARALLSLLHERRRLLADTPAKLDALLALAPAIGAADRSIVFTQSIAVAERARTALCSVRLRAGTVHSQLSSLQRRETLARFAAGSLEVVVAPRVLDEGIDVPEADLAVVVAASRSRRQMVQRMGRVLRRKPDGRRARIAVLYVAGTVEDPAAGAHEAFLSELVDVAEEVCDFRSPRQWPAAASFLFP